MPHPRPCSCALHPPQVYKALQLSEGFSAMGSAATWDTIRNRKMEDFKEVRPMCAWGDGCDCTSNSLGHGGNGGRYIIMRIDVSTREGSTSLLKAARRVCDEPFPVILLHFVARAAGSGLCLPRPRVCGNQLCQSHAACPPLPPYLLIS